MRIAIHQPQYIPWLGYFDKMDSSDVFVILDDVQYKKNEWQNRNKIRNAESWQWLTVPVKYEFGQAMDQVKLEEGSGWRAKHLKSIELNYSRAPHYKEHQPFFADLYGKETRTIADVNTLFIEYLKTALGINAKLVRSSELNIRTASTRRLVDICKALGGDTYLSGAGGAEYLDETMFSSSGIALEYQDYKHPVYKQVFEGFEPYMSVIDLLFCEGDNSLNVIRGGRVK